MLPNTWDLVLPLLPGEKKRHYWIWSAEPNRGKTTWLRMLDTKYKCSKYSYDEKFQKIYADT
jgi:hypothetical protein